MKTLSLKLVPFENRTEETNLNSNLSKKKKNAWEHFLFDFFLIFFKQLGFWKDVHFVIDSILGKGNRIFIYFYYYFFIFIMFLFIIFYKLRKIWWPSFFFQASFLMRLASILTSWMFTNETGLRWEEKPETRESLSW